MYRDDRDAREDPRELSSRELRTAELGFRRLLRARRFPRAFRDRHVADLLAQARLEYARHLAAGERIESPAAWIIHCAWRRTQNLLERECGSPDPVPLRPSDRSEEVLTPEQEVLGADRRERLREAIGQLRAEERELLTLTYFEGMSVREASRTLRWDKCKGDRRHHAALEHLRKLIGAERIEDFEIEIGICAWASLRAGHDSGVLDRLTETASRLAAAPIDRAQELARRLLTGGAAEPGLGAGAGAVTRTAGACGALAVACLATGVVGPGLGGLDVAADRAAKKPAAEHRRAAQAAERAEPAGEGRLTSIPASEAGDDEGAKRSAGAAGSKARRSSGSTGTAASTHLASPEQVEEEFDPFTGGEAAPAEASGPSAAAPSQSGGAGTGSSPSRRATGSQVEAEFGL